MLRSLTTMGTEQGGRLPVFPCWNAATGAMIGDHTAVIIADGLLKGIFNASNDKDAFVQRVIDLVLRNALDASTANEARPGIES